MIFSTGILAKAASRFAVRQPSLVHVGGGDAYVTASSLSAAVTAGAAAVFAGSAA
jgi:hypothetical protein